MGLHAYCIVPAEHVPAVTLPGLGDAMVHAAPAGSLAVWTSAHEHPPVASIDTVRRHNDVVHAAMTEAVTPVPLRFGQWFESETALVERITEGEPHWSAQLARFAGLAEYGVALLGGRDPARDVRPAATTGTAYMQQLARRQAETMGQRSVVERIAGDVATRLEGLVTDSRTSIPAGGNVLARLVYLVAWSDADAYHGVMREFPRSWPELRWHLSGPWPPWSFTE